MTALVLADVDGRVLEAWRGIGKDTSLVTIHHGSIFDVQCDALVSPANSYGFMDGGIDLAISEFFGWQVQARLQSIPESKTPSLSKG